MEDARREEMRGRQAHRDYAALVTDVRRAEVAGELAAGFRLFSQQLSLGASLLVTLVSAALLGYFAGRAWFGPARHADALALAAGSGVTLFVVEAVLIVGRLSRIDAKAAAAKAVGGGGGESSEGGASSAGIPGSAAWKGGRRGGGAAAPPPMPPAR